MWLCCGVVVVVVVVGKKKTASRHQVSECVKKESLVLYEPYMEQIQMGSPMERERQFVAVQTLTRLGIGGGRASLRRVAWRASWIQIGPHVECP